MADNDKELLTFERFLQRWGEEKVREMRERLAAAGKGGGNLSKSIKLNKVIKKNNSYIFKYTMLKYGIFVDKGRRKGKMPPLKAIKEWCSSKGIDKKYAFPIAKEIGRTGIYGINFTRNVTKMSIDDLNEMKVEYAKYVKEWTLNNLNAELKNKK